jgi:hypothetical protein
VTNSQGVPGSRTFQGGIADGYLALTNEYDGYTYVYGKGQSSTSVAAPQTAVTLGQSIEITGTVLDQSPAQPGTPAIGDEYVGEWMDYIHSSRPKPNAIGVPVSIDAYDPNGNFIHIGDVTSNVDGSFQKLWKPDVAGEYTIIASFKGTNSYGSSSASTGVGVVNAPEATSTPSGSSEVIQAPISTFEIAIMIAVIVAILIGVINLRKH